MNHSAIDITEDITYAQLAAMVSVSKLFKGKSYRISDFATKHTIPTTSVDNTGVTEPIIVTAEETNKIRPLVFSEAYPSDVILYSMDNSYIPGADKGCILYRHDFLKNISAYYDWRSVKFRDYAGLWQSSNVTIGSGARSKTLVAGAGADVLTFFDISDPVNVSNVSIGLLSPNNRLNNITFSGADSGSYVREISNVSIADGCKDMRFVPSSLATGGVFINCRIGPSCSQIQFSSSSQTSSLGGVRVTVGSYVTLCRLGDVSTDNGLSVGDGCNNLYIGSGSGFIGNDCNNITVANLGNCVFLDGCYNIYQNNSCDLTAIQFGARCHDISFTPGGASHSNLTFCAGFSNKTINYGSTSNTSYTINSPTAKTWTVGQSGVTFSMVDSNGDLWGQTITTGGVVTTTKQA